MTRLIHRPFTHSLSPSLSDGLGEYAQKKTTQSWMCLHSSFYPNVNKRTSFTRPTHHFDSMMTVHFSRGAKEHTGRNSNANRRSLCVLTFLFVIKNKYNISSKGQSKRRCKGHKNLRAIESDFFWLARSNKDDAFVTWIDMKSKTHLKVW